MKLPKSMRKRLADELRVAAQKMQADSDPFNRVFLFSAAYGEVGRLLNTAWDAELALLHMVLMGTHQAVNARIGAIAAGADRAIGLPGNLLDELTTATTELADMIRDGRDGELVRILARFTELAFVTTGNGYYLYLKGAIRI